MYKTTFGYGETLLRWHSHSLWPNWGQQRSLAGEEWKERETERRKRERRALDIYPEAQFATLTEGTARMSDITQMPLLFQYYLGYRLSTFSCTTCYKSHILLRRN